MRKKKYEIEKFEKKNKKRYWDGGSPTPFEIEMPFLYSWHYQIIKSIKMIHEIKIVSAKKRELVLDILHITHKFNHETNKTTHVRGWERMKYLIK